MSTGKLPFKQNYRKELLMTAIFLIVIGVVVAFLAKLVVGGIIFLLGVVFGAGTQLGRNDSLE